MSLPSKSPAVRKENDSTIIKESDSKENGFQGSKEGSIEAPEEEKMGVGKASIRPTLEATAAAPPNKRENTENCAGDDGGGGTRPGVAHTTAAEVAVTDGARGIGYIAKVKTWLGASSGEE